MMKSSITITLLLILLFFVQSANAATLKSWDIDIDVSADKSSLWKVSLSYDGPVQKDDYWVFAQLSDISVSVDGMPAICKIVQPEIGTSIICDNINGSNIVYSFTATGPVSNINSFNAFRYVFSVTRITDSFSVTIKLPLGAAIVEKEKLVGTGMMPFEPSFGREGSDGRRIFVRWELKNPRLAESLNVIILYEPIMILSQDVLLLITIIMIVAFAIALYYLRHRARNILPVLTPAERRVVEILMRKKVVDQREIVRETDFSKAKVSRILKTLHERGIIETRPKGRTKEVKLMLGKPKEEVEEKKHHKIVI